MDGPITAQTQIPLKILTSFGCGGPAACLYRVTSVEELQALLATDLPRPHWLLGYGTNVLVSDHGLDGTVLVMRGGHVMLDENSGLLVVDAGTWWDEAVERAVNEGLWGIELMSGIPGNAGAAVAGNIAAYGQAVADTLVWVEAYDSDTFQTKRLRAEDLKLAYRSSAFHGGELEGMIILRAAFSLATTPTTDLAYQSALDVAHELDLDTDSLQHRRRIILEARGRVGSLYDSEVNAHYKSAGSFFKNPLVTPEQADYVAGFDESGRTRQQLDEQNRIHGGDSARVSAALVLLAAGFKRGQEFGPVRLHPKHVLKIENTGEATAQDVYDTASHIMRTAKDQLDITLEPEVRLLGVFDD